MPSSQLTRQYLNPISVMLHSSGLKTLIQSKDLICYSKISQDNVLFSTGPLFKDSKSLKFFDKTAIENCTFISKSVKGLLPSVLKELVQMFSFEYHSCDTRLEKIGYLKIHS